jgi:Putative Flp pilus-assembly TadE/G-like
MMPTTLLSRIVRGAALRSEPGQVLVIVAVGLIAMIAMVGLVIDGGYAWGRQRTTANGADAVAKAGTVVVLEWLDQKPKTIGDVGCAVDLAEVENGVTVERAEFTDHTGELINVAVPDCGTAGAIPADAQGVRVGASQTFDTFLMSVVGIRQLTATANATAIVGPITGSGVGLPVTFPQTMELCDDSGDIHTIRDWAEPNYDGSGAGDGDWTPYEILPLDATLDDTNLAIIPLCTTAPGSVGWLDYGCGNLADQILDPCDIFVSIPGWLETHTGNINCCEDELATYHGNEPGVYEEDGVDTDGDYDVPVKLPIHTTTCEEAPDPGTFDSDGDGDHDTLVACPGGQWDGQGNNLDYGVPFWVAFVLDEAFVQGSDNECEELPGAPQLDNPSGLTGCLKGWFVQRIGPPDAVSIGDVNPGDEVDLGVTLIN